ncbi:MAG: multidrug effflux MFS transporter [Paracoccaceae bacterium]
MMAMMFATIAFSVDAMLPVLPDIATDLKLSDPQQAPLILTLFLVGLGVGTFFAGPLSDRFGRKNLVYGGLAIYVLGAVIAWATETIEWMLFGRLVQGLGAAGPRIVSLAIIRDLFSGRDMARIMSLAMMIFLIFPAIAPAIGALIADAFHWRLIFAAFVMFALILIIWFGLRLKETLPEDKRRPLRLRSIGAAVAEMLGHRIVRLSIFAQTMMLATLFGVLTMVEPIFSETFQRPESFPYWFGAIALASGFSSLANAALVGRFGMRKLVTLALVAQLIISSSALILLWEPSSIAFPVYIFWQFGVLFQAGMTVANLNAIAMQPMGHIAGIAASVIGAISTVMGAVIASPLAMLFDGTPRPLIAAVLMMTLISTILMHRMRQLELA